MFEFHTDKARYFEMQRATAAEHVLPMIGAHLGASSWRVLEVGCAEAGVLKAFLDQGHTGVGIELELSRANTARQMLASEIRDGRVEIRTDNIYDVQPADLGEPFDVIILKDVIEHIPQQERMLPRLAEFLRPGGVIFFGFPPWQMPFGGHQQIAMTKWVNKVPWIHLLPEAAYAKWVARAGEPAHIREELADIRSTRISLERFERIVPASGLRIAERKLWLLNPIYALKFGWKPVVLPEVFTRVPYLRNFYTTAAFYVVGHAASAKTRARTTSSPHLSEQS